MYTRCPGCQTYFKISAEQLKKAGGKVRCGQCFQVFNSIGNLIEQLPVALVHKDLSAKPKLAATPLPIDEEPSFEVSFSEPEPPPPPPPRAKPVRDEPPSFNLHAADDTLHLTDHDKVEAVDVGPHSPARDMVVYPAPAAATPGSLFGTAFWSVGVVFLLGIFIVQYSYYMRDDLARYDEFRPWIQKMCEIAQCEIPLQQDINMIKLSHRDIASHPRVKGALLINAIIVNNAPFAQPFPIMQITLSDTNGQVIARRRFQPVEYLDADINLKRGMPARSPVQIVLEIADPGKNAVNFEFNFFQQNS